MKIRVLGMIYLLFTILGSFEFGVHFGRGDPFSTLDAIFVILCAAGVSEIIWRNHD